jgi:hypothetical protein
MLTNELPVACFPYMSHAEMPYCISFRSAGFEATRCHSNSRGSIDEEETGRRRLTVSSLVYAEGSLNLLLQIADSVRNMNSHLFVVIDQAGFDSSMINI